MRSFVARLWLLALVATAAAFAEVVVPPPRRPASERQRPLLPARVPKNLNAFLSTPPRSDGGTERMVGQVLAPDGRPVAGAVVTAVQPDPAREGELMGPCVSDMRATPKACGCGDNQAALERLLDERQNEPEALARTTTDADGKFRLEGLPKSSLSVWVDARGFGPTYKVMSGDEPVRLRPATHVQGRVVNESNEPIAGAVATVVQFGRQFDAVSDGDGGFVVGPLAEQLDTLFVRRVGFLVASTEVYQSEARTITLVDPRVLQGSLTRDGGAVADAGLTAFNRFFKSCTATARTDAQGRYHFENLRPADYDVVADLGPLAARARTSLDVNDDVKELPLSLSPASRVSGFVSSQFIPCDGALAGAGDDRPEQMETPAGGTWRSSPLLPGRYTLIVRCNTAGFGPFELDLDCGMSVDLGKDFGGGAPLQGVVRDAKGAPVPSAEVWAFREHPRLTLRVRARSDDKGNFLFGALSPGKWSIVAQPDAPRQAKTEVTLPREAPLELKLKRVTKR